MSSDLRGHAWGDTLRYCKEKLSQRNTYIVAGIVGTFINLYGHFLVPALRGHPQPFDRFLDELIAAPALVGSSIVLAYCFPMLVGLYSSVATRVSVRELEYRAQFPDAKPDPVFRADPDGTITDIGANTQTFFGTHAIETAQDFVGEALWKQLASSNDERPNQGTLVYSDKVGAWFVISHSDGPGGTVNIYGSRARPPSTH